MLLDENGNEIIDLAELEPFRQSINGLPICRITYKRNSITIEWCSQEFLDSIQRWTI